MKVEKPVVVMTTTTSMAMMMMSRRGRRIVKYDTRKNILRKKQNGTAEGRRIINNLIIWYVTMQKGMNV